MSTTASETSLSADILRYVQYQLRGRRGLIAVAVVLGVPALWLSWPWLVVAGIAPILIALAPCLIMCGAMCAMNAGSKSGEGEAGSCSNSRSEDQAAASVDASRLADETREPMPLAVASQANATSVELESEVEAETTGETGAP